MTKKYIRSTARDLGQRSLRPPQRGEVWIRGCICRDVRSAIGVPRIRSYAGATDGGYRLGLYLPTSA
jgi:hypothetical protein